MCKHVPDFDSLVNDRRRHALERDLQNIVYTSDTVATLHYRVFEWYTGNRKRFPFSTGKEGCKSVGSIECGYDTQTEIP